MSILLLLSLLLSSLGLSSSYAAQAAPVNPDATQEAKDVLSVLYNVSGKSVIAGQHDYLESPDELSNKLDKISGQYAGVHGYELGAISGQSEALTEQQRSNVVYSAINWYRAGGFVTMTFHESLPGTKLTWANVQKSISQADFDQYITPGTAEYNALISDIDSVAVSLKKLKDAGVPVLWRPYHEMNGNWFWWGRKDNFTELWNIMYDRLVHVHQLDNLIWVWSPNAPNSSCDAYTPYFPGLDKVDVLALDIYNNDYKQSYYDGIVSLAKGKPVAIGENGELPNVSLLAKSQPKWAYFLTWGSMLTDNNSTQTINSVMNDNRVITRDKLGLVSKTPFELGDPASSAPDEGATPMFPAPQVPLVLISGLSGEYYANQTLSGSPLVRTDSKIDFSWKSASPAASIPSDHFSVRWSGEVKPQYSELYTFSTITDDGVRVWVDGKLLIDSWVNQSWYERRGNIELNAGQLYDIKVEYYDSTGDSMARLMWQSQSQAKETVPASALFQYKYS